MRSLYQDLEKLSGRIDLRARLILLVACLAGLTVLAYSSVAAMQDGNLSDAIAGFLVLPFFAVGAAVACTRGTRRG